jgi:putative phage-type endonuclease
VAKAKKKIINAVLPRWVELEQGSEAWHAWRAERYTASQAGAVVGEGAFWPRTPYQLYLLRTGQRQVEVTPAMRAGSASEPRQRELLDFLLDSTAVPMCAEWDMDGIPLGASLDAVCLDRGEAHELKRPAAGSQSPLWKATEAPKGYLWQMVHQMLVMPMEVQQVHLTVYAHDLDALKTIDVLHRNSDRFIDLCTRLIEGWLSFHRCVVDFSPPPLVEADEVVLEDDAEWRLACEKYQVALATSKTAGDILAEAKAELEQLAQVRGEGAKVRGSGLQVFKVTRPGSINYKAADIQKALSGLDLEKYRGKASIYWTIKEG